MEAKKECKRATEIEHENENISTVLFTAGGTVLLMVFLKRALVMLFIEQWRAWIFLVLNLILLAIFFSSIHSTTSENQESNNNVEMNIEKKKKRKQCRLPAKDEGCNDCYKSHERRNSEIEQKLEHEHVEDNSEPPRLSKEELNERVEAFIAMFRQHLVSDARKGRNQFFSQPKQAQMLKLPNKCNLTFTTQRVKGLILEV